MSRRGRRREGPIQVRLPAMRGGAGGVGGAAVAEGAIPPREQLLRAWRWREERGILAELGAVRVFHGPGEGSGDLSEIAIDRFGDHFWITRWSDPGAGSGKKAGDAELIGGVAGFLDERKARSAVLLERPLAGLPAEGRAILGEPPEGRFMVHEGEAGFWIQLRHTRHPGLFLDHLPLRRWLRARMRGLSVLNAFSYTGSLSVAAGLGGAASVTSLDLSRTTLSWAEENWRANGLPPGRSRMIAGDYFEWLPRLRREGSRFGCVILDPPSHSRGKKGDFSTARDLARLHEAALGVLEPGGFLVTSINSANVTSERFEDELRAAARGTGLGMRILSRIELPETFPTRLESPEDRYLKGWILQVG